MVGSYFSTKMDWTNWTVCSTRLRYLEQEERLELLQTRKEKKKRGKKWSEKDGHGGKKKENQREKITKIKNKRRENGRIVVV